ncbi:MAG: OmpH family outer membrane protein [Bdellovibrionota bacterium]
MTSKTTFLMFAAALMLAAPVAQAEEMKIGYIDIQKAIQGTSAGKKAKSDLEKEFNAKNSEFQKRQADFKKMGEDLEKKKLALSDEARAKKAQELQGEFMKLQKDMGESQLGMQKKEAEALKPIVEKLEKAIDKVAKDGGYTMILEKGQQSVVWAKKDLDLTDTVVKEFEKTTK